MKLKFDHKSIKARIGIHFIIFAMILLLCLWVAQVLFLNTFYHSMKENTTKNVMRQLETSYNKDDTIGFVSTISELAENNDVYIYVNHIDGTPMIRTSSDAAYTRHSTDIQLVNKAMLEENTNAVSLIVKSQDGTREQLASGLILSNDEKPTLIAYCISPLFPMQSTIAILEKQLMAATALALILALILALYISNRIATPIRSITRNANRLAQGEYGIVFQGGHYTELAELAETLTHASIELEKSTSLQKDLIANVSHDLKTPLTMVKSYAEMIRDLSGDNPEKREKHLQVIIEEADRLNNLVNDILMISKMQSGAIIIKSEDFNLHSEIENIFMYYKLLMEEEGYIINFSCPENLIVKGDPDRIKQVFANLINNAIKFSGEDKTVTVAVEKKGKTARCTVHDNGAGISPEDLPHIWERYYKSSTNMVRSSSGSGLGLSIVKEILSLHKVPFGVSSPPGEGTTFWFELDIK